MKLFKSKFLLIAFIALAIGVLLFNEPFDSDRPSEVDVLSSVNSSPSGTSVETALNDAVTHEETHLKTDIQQEPR